MRSHHTLTCLQKRAKRLKNKQINNTLNFCNCKYRTFFLITAYYSQKIIVFFSFFLIFSIFAPKKIAGLPFFCGKWNEEGGMGPHLFRQKDHFLWNEEGGTRNGPTSSVGHFLNKTENLANATNLL